MSRSIKMHFIHIRLRCIHSTLLSRLSESSRQFLRNIGNDEPEGFLSGVGAHMGCKVSRLTEALMAICTPVGFLPAVCAQVGLEGARPRVCLAANSAQIWPRTFFALQVRHMRRTGPWNTFAPLIARDKLNFLSDVDKVIN